ncbi:MAG: YihY/virulence factor BrkB family protein [Clostridia bacterium]|nr:YihY/virulence factor BrkB family protein [Clostridiales bacterium]MBQ3506049.1 YihY/virulence factor BrkB family protein [Clostridia bacterium]
MEQLRKSYRYLKDKYRLLSEKKYTTIAGTLVFFLIMSVVPLAFWLTLIIGRLPVKFDGIFRLSVFDSVKNVFSYVQREAENATASVSVLLLVTTLYSATNLFYQMRRSGEIIYEHRHETQGLRMRVGAVALMFIVMLLVAAFALALAVGTFLFSRLLPEKLEIVADYLLLIALSFALVLLLNAYICPYKRPLKTFVRGTLITVVAWAGAVIGFTVYLRVSNVARLYGALSVIIVFLLWLYVLMICFIAGVIFNSEAIETQRKAKNRARRKKPKPA